MAHTNIVAVGLLTRRDLDILGSGFTRAFPIDDSPCFTELLRAIDEAERQRDMSGPRSDAASPD